MLPYSVTARSGYEIVDCTLNSGIGLYVHPLTILNTSISSKLNSPCLKILAHHQPILIYYQNKMYTTNIDVIDPDYLDYEVDLNTCTLIELEDNETSLVDHLGGICEIEYRNSKYYIKDMYQTLVTNIEFMNQHININIEIQTSKLPNILDSYAVAKARFEIVYPNYLKADSETTLMKRNNREAKLSKDLYNEIEELRFRIMKLENISANTFMPKRIQINPKKTSESRNAESDLFKSYVNILSSDVSLRTINREYCKKVGSVAGMLVCQNNKVFLNLALTHRVNVMNFDHLANLKRPIMSRFNICTAISVVPDKFVSEDQMQEAYRKVCESIKSRSLRLNANPIGSLPNESLEFETHVKDLLDSNAPEIYGFRIFINKCVEIQNANSPIKSEFVIN